MENITISYSAAKIHRNTLQEAHSLTSAVLCRVSGTERTTMGMIPDTIKALPEWIAAYRAERAAFKALRVFNGWFVKRFKKELREERKHRCGE